MINASTAHEASLELRNQALRMSLGEEINKKLFLQCLDAVDQFTYEQMQEEIAG